MLCEGYLGLMLDIELWAKLFFLKRQGPATDIMSDCEATVVTDRSNGSFPKMPIEDSAKKWQNSFFSVRNTDPKADYINLPPFANETPHAKVKWGYQPKSPPREMLNICSHILR